MPVVKILCCLVFAVALLMLLCGVYGTGAMDRGSLYSLSLGDVVVHQVRATRSATLAIVGAIGVAASVLLFAAVSVCESIERHVRPIWRLLNQQVNPVPVEVVRDAKE